METINSRILTSLYCQPKNSHKGQNGKLTIIGGSKLFHGASLWALKIASRIVDMVFFSTVKDNKELAQDLKSKLYDFIYIPRNKIEDYILQSDAVLIGPGMVRGSNQDSGTGENGQQTRKLTKSLLAKFPQKKWIIDAGALQTISPSWLKKLNKPIITPHFKEFEQLFNITTKNYAEDKQDKQDKLKTLVLAKAKQFKAIIVLKGKTDIVCNQEKCWLNTTGNEGMTKGGTGDVLAGLIAALACKNESFLAAVAGLYINGLAGDEIYKRVGPYFNASDLADEIPRVMKELII